MVIINPNAIGINILLIFLPEYRKPTKQIAKAITINEHSILSIIILYYLNHFEVFS